MKRIILKNNVWPQTIEYIMITSQKSVALPNFNSEMCSIGGIGGF